MNEPSLLGALEGEVGVSPLVLIPVVQENTFQGREYRLFPGAAAILLNPVQIDIDPLSQRVDRWRPPGGDIFSPDTWGIRLPVPSHVLTNLIALVWLLDSLGSNSFTPKSSEERGRTRKPRTVPPTVSTIATRDRLKPYAQDEEPGPGTRPVRMRGLDHPHLRPFHMERIEKSIGAAFNSKMLKNTHELSFEPQPNGQRMGMDALGQNVIQPSFWGGSECRATVFTDSRGINFVRNNPDHIKARTHFEDQIQRTAFHELAHSFFEEIKCNHPDLFREFRNAVRGSGKSITAYERVYRKTANIAEDTLLHEAFAETVAEMLMGGSLSGFETREKILVEAWRRYGMDITQSRAQIAELSAHSRHKAQKVNNRYRYSARVAGDDRRFLGFGLSYPEKKALSA